MPSKRRKKWRKLITCLHSPMPSITLPSLFGHPAILASACFRSTLRFRPCGTGFAALSPADAGLLGAALSTRILGLFYKAVSREVFVFSVVNRLLVRRLLRPALIAEQFCHVHLPSNLSEQADHFLRSQLPPSYPHVCSNVLRQRPILGRDFVREIVP